MASLKQPDTTTPDEPVTEEVSPPPREKSLSEKLRERVPFFREYVFHLTVELLERAAARIEELERFITEIGARDEMWAVARYRAEHEGEQSLEFPEDCYVSGFDIAFDVDSTPHQYTHVAYTYPSGALCGTKLLWFHGGPLTAQNLDLVDCPTCLHIWQKRGLVLGGTEPEKDAVQP